MSVIYLGQTAPPEGGAPSEIWVSFYGEDGAWTGMNTTTENNEFAAFQVTQGIANIPEPSTYALLLVGLGALVIIRSLSRTFSRRAATAKRELLSQPSG